MGTVYKAVIVTALPPPSTGRTQ